MIWNAYTIMGLSGFAAGMFTIACNLAQTEPYSHSRKSRAVVLGICSAGFLSALAFARLSSYAFNREMPQSLAQLVHRGGYVWYPGELGALALVAVLVWAVRLSVGNTLNLVIPSFPLVHAFGRVGCALSGCCYGMRVDHPLFGYPAWRVPTQIIEAVFCAGLFFALEFAVRRHRTPLYFAAYAVFRFIIEFCRGDDRGALIPGIPLSPAQQIAAGCLAAVLIWMLLPLLRMPAKSKGQKPAPHTIHSN